MRQVNCEFYAKPLAN